MVMTLLSKRANPIWLRSQPESKTIFELVKALANEMYEVFIKNLPATMSRPATMNMRLVAAKTRK